MIVASGSSDLRYSRQSKFASLKDRRRCFCAPLWNRLRRVTSRKLEICTWTQQTIYTWTKNKWAKHSALGYCTAKTTHPTKSNSLVSSQIVVFFNLVLNLYAEQEQKGLDYYCYLENICQMLRSAMVLLHWATVSLNLRRFRLLCSILICQCSKTVALSKNTFWFCFVYKSQTKIKTTFWLETRLLDLVVLMQTHLHETSMRQRNVQSFPERHTHDLKCQIQSWIWKYCCSYSYLI